MAPHTEPGVRYMLSGTWFPSLDALVECVHFYMDTSTEWGLWELPQILGAFQALICGLRIGFVLGSLKEGLMFID